MNENDCHTYEIEELDRKILLLIKFVQKKDGKVKISQHL